MNFAEKTDELSLVKIELKLKIWVEKKKWVKIFPYTYKCKSSYFSANLFLYVFH